MGLGFGELAIILVIILFLFGGKKLPELGNSVGRAIKNFKQGMNEGKDDDDKTKKS